MGNSSYVFNPDWLDDSTGLQVTDGAHELLFYGADGKQLKKKKAMRGFTHDKLATHTSELGWAVQGIWPSGADGTDINRCARSHDRTLLATADDFGDVKLFRYPAVKEGSAFTVGRGHASHVAGVAFTADDKRLLTAGGN